MSRFSKYALQRGNPLYCESFERETRVEEWEREKEVEYQRINSCTPPQFWEAMTGHAVKAQPNAIAHQICFIGLLASTNCPVKSNNFTTRGTSDPFRSFCNSSVVIGRVMIIVLGFNVHLGCGNLPKLYASSQTRIKV